MAHSSDVTIDMKQTLLAEHCKILISGRKLNRELGKQIRELRELDMERVLREKDNLAEESSRDAKKKAKEDQELKKKRSKPKKYPVTQTVKMQLYTYLEHGINGFTKISASKAKELIDQLENVDIVTMEGAKMRLKEIIQKDDERRKQEKKSKEDQKLIKAANRVEINESSPEKTQPQNEILEKLLIEGSNTITDDTVKSKLKFSEALEIIKRNNKMKTCNEVVLIKYMFAR